jgi:hypothetical protein
MTGGFCRLYRGLLLVVSGRERLMTNNPDSKAPDRIWIDLIDSQWDATINPANVPSNLTEYIRPSPQQAAKVLLAAMSKSGHISGLYFNVNFEIKLEALAESKDD